MKPVVIILSSVAACDPESAAGEAKRFVAPVLVARDRRGYGAALANAICQSSELGYTHLIVLDVGRGHAPAYLPRFVEAIRLHPEAIVVGFRQYTQHRPRLMQRFGRWNCDLWTWIETDKWVHDTVYGYKAYPLGLIKDLAIRSEQTDCEVELLAKAAWNGVAIVQVALPTDATGERLMPLSPGEFTRFCTTTCMLSLQKLALPEPLRVMIHQKEFAELPLMQRFRAVCREAVAHNCQRPGRFAACVGLGVFFGIVPIWGLQLIAAATTAHLLGLSKPLVLTATHVSSPLTLPLILYASLIVGHLLLHGQLTGLPHLSQFGPTVLLHSLGEYLIGSTVLAICAGLTALLVSFTAASAIKRLRGIA